jgi:hypothetical protein
MGDASSGYDVVSSSIWLLRGNGVASDLLFRVIGADTERDPVLGVMLLLLECRDLTMSGAGRSGVFGGESFVGVNAGLALSDSCMLRALCWRNCNGSST